MYKPKALGHQYIMDIPGAYEIHSMGSLVCLGIMTLEAQSRAKAPWVSRRICNICATVSLYEHKISYFNEGERPATRYVANGHSHQLPDMASSRASRAVPPSPYRAQELSEQYYTRLN